MNLKQYAYEIFKTNEANGGADVLNVGLPMFMDDIMKGKSGYCPVHLDFESLKKQWDKLTVDERGQVNADIRRYISKNYNALVDAYPDRDKMLEADADNE